MTERSQATEVPWPREPVEAKLSWQRGATRDEGSEEGFLHFYGPDGKRAVVPITREPHSQYIFQGRTFNIWHIEVDGEIATVSPSVHYLGSWHSPNPVRFRLVDEIQQPE